MINNSSEDIIGYHYTNSKAYKSMKTRGIDRYSSIKYNKFTGLIPRRRFVNLLEGKGLPEKAYDGIIEGLLEPEPDSWTKNPEFPHLWHYLMHDICRYDDVILLSFKFLPKDEAYIVDRAHVERELYRETKGQGKMTKKSRNIAFKKYWDSRISVFDYMTKNKNTKSEYAVPQIALWSGIEYSRLKIEWIKPVEEVWERVCDNDW